MLDSLTVKYESREISTKTLICIYNGNTEEENLNCTMENAYKSIKEYLTNSANNINVEIFKSYLLENVKINLNYIKDEQVKQKLEQEISKL